jgi:hypothetical protein
LAFSCQIARSKAGIINTLNTYIKHLLNATQLLPMSEAKLIYVLVATLLAKFGYFHVVISFQKKTKKDPEKQL